MDCHWQFLVGLQSAWFAGAAMRDVDLNELLTIDQVNAGWLTLHVLSVLATLCQGVRWRLLFHISNRRR